MLAEQGTTDPAATVRADWSLPIQFQPRLLPPARRSLVGNIFAEEIVVCMSDARRPTRREIQIVAAKIWADIQAGSARLAWRDIVPGCRRYQRMIAAARAALGDRQDEAGEGKPP